MQLLSRVLFRFTFFVQIFLLFCVSKTLCFYNINYIYKASGVVKDITDRYDSS